jgi:membrane protein DedA with SNARE-associated domain
MMSEKKISSAEDWFEKYGTKAVLFGRMVPGIRELISNLSCYFCFVEYF